MPLRDRRVNGSLWGQLKRGPLLGSLSVQSSMCSCENNFSLEGLDHDLLSPHESRDPRSLNSCFWTTKSSPLRTGGVFVTTQGPGTEE